MTTREPASWAVCLLQDDGNTDVCAVFETSEQAKRHVAKSAADLKPHLVVCQLLDARRWGFRFVDSYKP